MAASRPFNPFTADVRLIEAEAAVIAAEAAFDAVLALVQGACPHLLVVQSNLPSHVGNYRICAACRLVEEGTRWSFDPQHWSVGGGAPELLGNAPHRIVVQQPKGANFWSWRYQMTHTTLSSKEPLMTLTIHTTHYIYGREATTQVHSASTVFGLQFSLSRELQDFISASPRAQVLPIPQWMWDHFQEHGQFDWPLACVEGHILTAHAAPAPLYPRCDEALEDFHG